MGDTNYNFQKLTPIKQVDLDIYKEALDYVFQNDDIRNVGISGAYSAGKSSVIETYKTIKPEVKFLHISLSYFQSADQTNDPQPEQNENVSVCSMAEPEKARSLKMSKLLYSMGKIYRLYLWL